MQIENLFKIVITFKYITVFTVYEFIIFTAFFIK